MMYLGDFDGSAVIDFKFSTQTASGPTALTSGTVSVYKDNDTAQSTAGVTLTADFDSVTGLNHVRVTMASDTSFYAVGSTFAAVLTAGTVGGVSVVGSVLAHWSIRSRSFYQGLRKLANRWAISADGQTLTVYQEDGSTVAYTQTVTSTSNAAPVTGLT